MSERFYDSEEEKKQLAKELKISEARYASLVEDSHDLICRWLPDTTLTYVNKSYCNYFGQKSEELLGKSWVDLLPEDSQDEVRRMVSSLVSKPEKIDYEHKLLGADGKERWMAWCINPVYDENGKLIEFHSSGRDISERKRFEQELSRSEERFQKMLSLVPDMISLHDPDMNIIYSNWNGFGAVPEEKRVFNTKCYRTYRDRDDICPDCHALTVLHTRETLQEEVELPEGNWVDLRVIPILGEDGSVKLFVEWVKDMTAQKQAERDIQNLVENAPDMIVRFNAKLENIYCNAAVEQYFGVPEEYLLGKTFADIARDMGEQADGNLRIMHDTLNRCLETRKEQQVELCFRLQGEEKWFSARVVPEFSNEGHLESLLAVSRDVTESKQMEQELQESEEKFRMLAESSPLAVMMYQNDYWVYANPAAEQITGYSIDELYNMQFWELNHPDYKESLKSIGKKRQEGFDEKTAYEFKIITKQGHEKWLFLSGATVNYQGAPAGMINCMDITEQKVIEEQLRESEKKYRLMFENSPLGILHFDQEGTITACNDNFVEIIGSSQEALIGLNMLNLPDKKIVAAVRQALNGEKGFYEDWYHSVTASKVTAVKAFFAPFVTEGDYITGGVGIVEDITDRKQAESELQRAYALLESEIEKASHIHDMILPQKIPQPRNISIAAHFKPAEIMGGDFYNVIQHDSKLIFYLSDVSGHGMDGAMVSVFIKEAIDSYIELKPESITPGRIIEHISKQYYRENYPDEQLICIFVGVIDLGSMELKYSSVGFQNHPLVHWGSGEKEELETSGLFISNMVPYELLNFEETSVYLDEGATMIFATDGLFEQKSGGEWFHRHIEEVFYRYSHFPPEIITQAVNKEFCLFNNHSLVGDDDITFLVLQVGSQPEQQKKYSFEISSDLAELKPLYEKISGILSEYEEKENFLTCLHELVANAMEHGNQLDPDKKVTVNLTLAPLFVAAQVADEGEGFNWCEKLNKPLNIEDFSERGRGIPLTNLLARNIFYNPAGNRATLVIEQ